MKPPYFPYSILPLLWLSTLTLTSGHPLTENPLEKHVRIATKDGLALECTCLCGDRNSWDTQSFATCLRSPSQTTWALAPSTNSNSTLTAVSINATEDHCQCLQQKCFCKPANIVQLQRRACTPNKDSSTDRFEDAQEYAFPTAEDGDTFYTATSKAFEANFKPVVVKKLNEIGGCISPTKCILPKGIEKVEMETLSMADEHWEELSPEELSTVLKFDLETLMDILTTDPNFKVAEELGRGGFGIVHAAKDASGADYAVKFPNMRKKFDAIMREVQQLQELNVLFEGQPERDLFLLPRRIFWLKADGKRAQLGIVMDRMDMDLSMLLQTRGFLEASELQTIGTALFKGLAELHKLKLMHNDIKPANILYNAPTAYSPAEVRLADFGLMNFFSESIKRIGGTPRYMSPEKVFGIGSSPQSDVWSAGVTMFEMSFGKFPYAEFKSALKAQLSDWVTSDKYWFNKATALAMFGENIHPKMFAEIPQELSAAVEGLAMPTIGQYLDGLIRPPGGPRPTIQQKRLIDLLDAIFKQSPENRPGAKDLISHSFFNNN